MRKGIILAGGKGTRLGPLTRAFSKHFLPVYDKPMFFYPLSTLLLSGINDILLIGNRSDIHLFKKILGDTEKFGFKVEYAVQDEPNGVAEALIIAEDFLAGAPCCLILGDNLFFGSGFSAMLKKTNQDISSNTIFSMPVKFPFQYGVIQKNQKGDIISIEEKPKSPKSQNVITGLYFFDSDASRKAKKVEFSHRRELEIVDVITQCLNTGNLRCVDLGRGFLWMDMGNFESLLSASEVIKSYQERLGVVIGSFDDLKRKS